MKRIYLDYAATTPLDKEVKKAMEPYFGSRFGNPNSLHLFGQEARAVIDMSRQKIAGSIGHLPAGGFEEIIFTGSATESNNLALRGVLKNLNTETLKHLKPKIIISAIEHDSVLETAKDLEKEGVEVVVLPVNKNGIVDLKKLKENIDERTILISIMYANNETGVIQPIAEIANIIRNFRSTKHEARKSKQIINSNNKIQNKEVSDFESMYPLFHTDAVQAFQFLDCNVNNLGIDMMTLSAHKIYGPKGVGVLYVSTKHEARKSKQIINSNNKIQNKEVSDFGFLISDLPAISPLVTGGGQEFGLRSGTENVAGIVGMAKAIELEDKNREKELKRIGELKNYFIKELKKIYPNAQINGTNGQNILPNILNVYFPDFKNEDLLIKLDMAGVAVSSGSACTSFAAKPSHVLKAMGFNEKRIKSSMRFSFGKFTAKDEIRKTIKILKKILV